MCLLGIGEQVEMATGRIAKRVVDGASPASADTYVWDDELSGFGLKVTPTGRKVYIVQYRLGGRRGRTRRVTIGQHGELTPASARIEAKRLLGEVALGRDPASDRDRLKADKSLTAVLDQFMSQHVKSKLKASTAREYERICELYVMPRLGCRPVSDIKRQDIAKLHHELASKPYQANRTLALLSKFFNWAEKHGLRPDGSNPCRHIEKYREGRRERFLSEDELARLGNALVKAETEESATPWAIAAVRLLIFTGARLSEILTLKWDYVDVSRGLLLLPDSKTGKKAIRLNEPARSVLDSLARVEGNPYAICGERPGRHLVNLQKPWRRIRRVAKLDDVRLHDLRHSFASVGAASGQSLVVIGKMLGHSQPATTARYAHLADDPVKAASDVVGARIAAAMAKGKLLENAATTESKVVTVDTKPTLPNP
jgi:integrase